MSRYLNPADIQDLIETRNKIFPARIDAYERHEIDVLSNDTLSSLSIWEVVSTYDPHYNVNFSRNDEDAISNGVKIEQKCSSIDKNKSGEYKEAVFMFHAMGDLEYPRYIFTTRDKKTLKLLKLYDIKQERHTQLIANHLYDLRQKWLKKGARSYDVINVPEKLLLDKIEFTDKKIIKDCEVYID